MIKRIRQFFQQFEFLFYDTRRMNNVSWWRWLSCWFTPAFWSVASYRIERSFYLLMGRGYQVVRVFISPLIFLLTPWLRPVDIHYKAQIDKGMIVLHPSLGLIISAHAVIGKNLVLTGGNCIGAFKQTEPGDLTIGDNLSMGVNSVILGPARIGNNVTLSPCTVAHNNIPDNTVLIGPTPEKIKKKNY